MLEYLPRLTMQEWLGELFIQLRDVHNADTQCHGSTTYPLNPTIPIFMTSWRSLLVL